MRMRHVAICGLPPLYNIFPHYLINGTIFGKKKIVEHKMCVWILSIFFFPETFLILTSLVV